MKTQRKNNIYGLAVITFIVSSSIVSPSALAQDNSNSNSEPTIARQWTDAALFAIRRDLARPTVHARNLFHLSAAMYDVWAMYDDKAIPVFMQASLASECEMTEQKKNDLVGPVQNNEADKKLAQQVAIGHAAWDVLNYRFKDTLNSTQLLAHFEQVATNQGLSESGLATDTDQIESVAALIGARVADCIIAAGAADKSNEANNYANIDYQPINPALDPTLPGNPGITDPNRWQPLQLNTFIDQSGNATDIPSFLGANWGQLDPFALTDTDMSNVSIDDQAVPTWLDPGIPPLLTDDPNTNATYLEGNALVVMWSAQLDPSNPTMVDISPGAIGNLGPLSGLANDQAGILAEYDGLNGGLGKATGHALNPQTGEAYPSNEVPLGDYTRVLAEFWADGPDSETPPGHWYSVYNEAVVSHPDHTTRLAGIGEPIDALEYDVLAYLALGGAMHDSAISAWSVKRAYDYVRPVSAIRYMASLGQSTDTTASNYHLHGAPLVEGLIETIQPGDVLAGENNENVGKIKARAWRGPDFITDPAIDVAGVDWILLDHWWPYQRPTFVTPPFAGYVSGHSTFSRAAAEVLTELTGDPFFPGGLAEFVAEKDNFLVFEQGPSVEVRLQWATYRDAADQTSLSRIWGGIHPPADDIVGRRMGEIVGIKAWEKVTQLHSGTNLPIDQDNEDIEDIEDDGSMTDIANGSAGSSGCSIAGNNAKAARSNSQFLLLLCLAAVWQIVFSRTIGQSSNRSFESV